MKMVAAAGLLITVGGCNLILGIESATPSGPDGSVPDSAVPTKISVTNAHVSDTDTEMIEVPVNPTVYWREGTAFKSRTGRDDRADTYLDVPDGVDYFVTWGGQNPLALTGSRAVDLGIWVIGRGGDWMDGTMGTRVNLTGSGLSPAWEASDRLMVFSPTTGQAFDISNPERLLTPAPTVGATAIGAGVNWEGWRLGGSDFGDKLFLVVTRWGIVNGNFIGLVKQVASMTLPATMPPGQTSETVGSFMASPTRTVSIDFKRSQFDALRLEANPMALHFTTKVTVKVQPVEMAGQNQSAYNTPWVLYFDNNEVTDVDLGTVTIANPYPPSWIYTRHVEFGFFVKFMMAGVERHADAYARSTVDVDSVGPLTTPAIGPVRGPTVNGRGAFADASDVGLNPVIAWMPPSLGTANRYVVHVWRYPPGVDYAEIVDLYVPGRITSIAIPPGVMKAGMWHVFVIDAVSSGGDAEAEPFLTRLPYASAPVITGKFAVGAAPF